MTISLDPTVADLVSEVDAYSARTGMSLSRMGDLIARDHKLLRQISRGEREPLPSTVAKIRKFMADHPEGERAK
jgi:hypothetical protein